MVSRPARVHCIDVAVWCWAADHRVRVAQPWVLVWAPHLEHALLAVAAVNCLMSTGRQTDTCQAVGRSVPVHVPAHRQTLILYWQCRTLANMRWVRSWTTPWRCHSLTCEVNIAQLLICRQNFFGDTKLPKRLLWFWFLLGLHNFTINHAVNYFKFKMLWINVIL